LLKIRFGWLHWTSRNALWWIRSVGAPDKIIAFVFSAAVDPVSIKSGIGEKVIVISSEIITPIRIPYCTRRSNMLSELAFRSRSNAVSVP